MNAIRRAGRISSWTVAVGAFALKSDLTLLKILWLIAALVCVGLAATYLGVGRLWLRGQQKQNVRPYFRASLIGSLLALGIFLLSAGMYAWAYWQLGGQVN